MGSIIGILDGEYLEFRLRMAHIRAADYICLGQTSRRGAIRRILGSFQGCIQRSQKLPEACTVKLCLGSHMMSIRDSCSDEEPNQDRHETSENRSSQNLGPSTLDSGPQGFFSKLKNKLWGVLIFMG